MNFERVLITPEAERHARAQHLLAGWPDLPVEKVSGIPEVQDWLKRNYPDPIGQGKRTLLLDVYSGEFLKPCPCTQSHINCGYWILNPVLGCPFDCSYCVLQEYLGPSPITVRLNWEDMLSEVSDYLTNRRARSSLRSRSYFGGGGLDSCPDLPFRIGTGELSDSLALEPWLGLAPALINFFAGQEGAVFELKTKSDRVECLEGLDHQGKTVVSWSVNPEEMIAREEQGAATLEARLQAAKRVAGWGYKVGFHFDPILDEPGAGEAYEEVVNKIFATVAPEQVAWTSLGALRFNPRLAPIVRERFSNSRILLGEFITGLDGKLRYLRFIRQPLLRRISGAIRQAAPQAWLYLCMETESVCQEVLPLSVI
ncbi:MAG: hypothetical protein A2V67_14755 [Deltaproteobacteria bacterium RBG_13_61_14]|nr:MAG: hypothetical protein A2V67_14755 [Deltaproteobacteria bacterium RBG_13_61_14]